MIWVPVLIGSFFLIGTLSLIIDSIVNSQPKFKTSLILEEKTKPKQSGDVVISIDLLDEKETFSIL